VNAIFYSIAFGRSSAAPIQLAESVKSLRAFDPRIQVFVFFFGAPPSGFIEFLRHLSVNVRDLGDYADYLIRKRPEGGELFALDPKLHRWLVLDEPELKACARLLYIDSDTIFLAPPAEIFDRYCEAQFYAREEPFCRRSASGYDPSILDEDLLTKLQSREGLNLVPPFNTGVCLFSRTMADAITSILPYYFDNLHRFLSWLHLHQSSDGLTENSSIQAIFDPRFRPVVDRVLPYPSGNSWIVDQVSLWLALGKLSSFSYADFHPVDVSQGAEFLKIPESRRLPIIIHYFSGNQDSFFPWLSKLLNLLASTDAV
jgi:hypothetical protein